MQESSFGFAPDQLDLAHLDQTQEAQAVPSLSAHSGSLSVQRQALPPRLTHLDSHCNANMVDVGQVRCCIMSYHSAPSWHSDWADGYCNLQKRVTTRTATASALVQLNQEAFDAVASDSKMAKGDALTVAQLAGKML